VTFSGRKVGKLFLGEGKGNILGLSYFRDLNILLGLYIRSFFHVIIRKFLKAGFGLIGRLLFNWGRLLFGHLFRRCFSRR
jgi:hypothetical protein